MLQVSTKDSLWKRNDSGRAENKNLSHLVGQPEDFEEEVQISKAGDESSPLQSRWSEPSCQILSKQRKNISIPSYSNVLGPERRPPPQSRKSARIYTVKSSQPADQKIRGKSFPWENPQAGFTIAASRDISWELVSDSAKCWLISSP